MFRLRVADHINVSESNLECEGQENARSGDKPPSAPEFAHNPVDCQYSPLDYGCSSLHGRSLLDGGGDCDCVDGASNCNRLQTAIVGLYFRS
jgi:hypothetical protein